MISIIFPVRNEQDNIKQLVEEASEVLKDRYELLFIEDSSTDETSQIVCKLASHYSNVHYVKNKQKGIPSAISTGIESAQSEIVCWMDADLSMPVSLVPKMITELKNHDIVIGSRYVEKGLDLRKSKLRVVSSKLFNLLSKKFLNTDINDLTSGFVVTKKEIVHKVGLKGRYGEYCIWFLYRAEKIGYRIKELPYTFEERNKGISKIGNNIMSLLKHSLFYFSMLLQLKFRDLVYYKKKR